MKAEFEAPVMSTVRYRSESAVTTMRSLSDEEVELVPTGDAYGSGIDEVGDCDRRNRLGKENKEQI
jgi:hypothetical protein